MHRKKDKQTRRKKDLRHIRKSLKKIMNKLNWRKLFSLQKEQKMRNVLSHANLGKKEKDIVHLL